MTIGSVLSSLQLCTSPPTGVTALSMSAAVVPGAKFCAITTGGPARPRMVRPPLLLLPLLLGHGLLLPFRWVAAAARRAEEAGESSVLMRACATCAVRRGLSRTRDAGPALGFVMRLAREEVLAGGVGRGVDGAEWRSCRSCVHSPSMLPA